MCDLSRRLSTPLLNSQEFQQFEEDSFLIQKILTKKLIYPIILVFIGVDSTFFVSNDIKLITLSYVYKKVFNFEYVSADNNLKRYKYSWILSYFLLFLNLILNMGLFISFWMLIETSFGTFKDVDYMFVIKRIFYFGFSIFIFVTLAFLISEWVKSKIKGISFGSKFSEINSIKSAKERLSIVFDAFIYTSYFILFSVSFILGISNYQNRERLL